ncbi:MAG TPA: hypothetical protein VGO00_30310, partial [Kofleriaceae bacterium]|nr:hypothetical protein [Kofleriaceae bacterium]
MRRLTGFFVIALTSSIAWGQPARSPEPKSVASIPGIPLQVVQTLPKTHQAVVFEKNRATHVLIEVGG